MDGLTASLFGGSLLYRVVKMSFCVTFSLSDPADSGRKAVSHEGPGLLCSGDRKR